MQALLEKQQNSLQRLEDLSKQDRLLQLVQTKELLSVDSDTTDMIEQMQNLNDNFLRMFEEIKKSVVNVDVVAYQELASKNSMSLPQIARDINVSRQNLQEIVRQSDGDVKTGADMHFRKSSENESLMRNDVAERKERIKTEGVSFVGGDNLSEEEATLEQNRMIDGQTDLLMKIEENTRSNARTPQEKRKEEKESASGGIVDTIKNLLGGAGRGIAGGLKTAGSFALKRAPIIAAGAMVLGGAFNARKAFQRSSAKEAESLQDIDARVQSGEITEDEAKGLRQEAKKEGTVGRQSAVGEGVGTGGGALLGMKGGAIAGAKVGAFLGPKGAAAGALIGGTIGAISGSRVGGQIGEFVGKASGRITNFFKGDRGESDKVKKAEVEKGSSVEIEFSEMKFAQNDPENYKKFRIERDGLIEKYATDRAKKANKKEPTQIDYDIAKSKAQLETIQKYRTEIEAAGAGKVTGGKKEEPAKLPGENTPTPITQEAEAKPSIGTRVLDAASKAIPVVGAARKIVSGAGRALSSMFGGSRSTETPTTSADAPASFADTAQKTSEDQRVAKGLDNPERVKKERELRIAERRGNLPEVNRLNRELREIESREMRGQSTSRLAPAQTPSSGAVVSAASGENEQAKMEASKGGGNSAIVAAPTTINNQTIQNQSPKQRPRNSDHTVNKYLESRYA
jgi:hypothetical protein